MTKRKELNISAEMPLPIAAVTSTMVVYGGKGMGKTNLGAVMAEELAANQLRFSVIDPMGVWWGLRYSADGKGNGVECLILGGAHGDIPIEPTGGAVVADLVADERVNVVIDISRKANGEMWSIADRIRFMRDYGKQLFKRQGSLIDGRRREPICQIVDEAARFVPQMIRAGQPELAECAGIWAAIVEEGRNVGLGVLLLTQRSARLSKDVAELADIMLAFRTVGPNSIEAVTDWLGAHLPKQKINEAIEQVRSLPVGSCMAVSPGWLKIERVIAIRMRHTFDSSATPKPGEQTAKVRGAGAKPDLALYAERMKETIERAKEDSVPELKKRIRELQAQVAKPATTASSQASSAALTALQSGNVRLKAEVRELERKLDDRQRKANKLVLFMSKSLKPMVEALEKVLEEFRSEAPVAPIAEVVSMPTPASAPMLVQHAKRVVPARPSNFNDVAASAGERTLKGAALKIAGIAAGYAERGEGISRKLLATLLGMSESGGGFAARLSEARTAGAIETRGGDVFATPEGRATYAGAFHAPSTTEEVVDLWKGKLGGKAREMFLHLVQLRGDSISRSELAEAVSMSAEGGGFAARLSEARSTGLLVEGGGRVAVNRELLFL